MTAINLDYLGEASFIFESSVIMIIFICLFT